MDVRYSGNQGYSENSARSVENNRKTHKISMINRKAMLLTGVNEIISFDNNEVLLETQQGTLMIRGHELHISRLNLEIGETDIDGRIDGMIYSDSSGDGKKSGGVLAKLFR